MPYDSDQTRTPLIVVTEALPSEETLQDPTVKFPAFFFLKNFLRCYDKKNTY
jgi:hypothetical protein